MLKLCTKPAARRRVLAATSFLDSFTFKTTSVDDLNNQADPAASPAEATPKVTGIGGVFFFADNPQELRDWYANNLGFEINAWGAASFDSRDLNQPEEVNTLQWSPFRKGDAYFAPSKKEFMLNYRVQNLEGLVSKLKESGVTILDDMLTGEYGKFVHILDAEGNKIELWEPPLE